MWGALLLLKHLIKGARGQGMVEYGLIIGLVALLLVGVLLLLGGNDSLGSLYDRIANGIAAAAPSIT